MGRYKSNDIWYIWNKLKYSISHKSASTAYDKIYYLSIAALRRQPAAATTRTPDPGPRGDLVLARKLCPLAALFLGTHKHDTTTTDSPDPDPAWRGCSASRTRGCPPQRGGSAGGS